MLPASPAIPAPKLNAMIFSRLTGMPISSDGERVLARGLPRPARSRLAEEVEHDQDHHDDAEQEPVVAAGGVDHDVPAEEPERVDVGEAVRAVGDPVRVGGVREHHERLAEEEGDDREVVAEQPPRRGAEEEPEQRADRDAERDRVLRVPVVGERVALLAVRAREEGVDVRAEAEEGDVAEVEQPGEPDDHVQPEREQRVDQDEDAVVEEVPARDREERDQDRRREQRQLPGGRQDPPEVDDPARAGPAARSRRSSAWATHWSTPICRPSSAGAPGVARVGSVIAPTPSGAPACRAGRSAARA